MDKGIEIVLFDNNKKTNERSPDKTGTVTFPDGRVMDVAMWSNVSKTQTPYLKGVIKEKFQKNSGASNSVKIDF